MDEFQLKFLKNGCDWKVGRRETVSEPPIQFSLQPGSHSRIMSWALSRQSPHLSLEQFNISLELLKNKRDLSAVRLGPEKWLRQKVVFRFKKWKRIISLIIFEMKQRELRDGASQVLRQEKVVGEKFRLYGEKWYWVKVLLSVGGNERGLGFTGMGKLFQFPPKLI